jgi:hypothetical protein
MVQEAQSDGRRSTGRVTPLDRSRELFPWRRAEQLTSCYVYWMPASAFPMPGSERGWFLEFAHRLAEMLSKDFGLRPEVFLRMKTLEQSRELKADFVKSAMELRPMLGLSRRPDSQPPSLPTEQDLKDLQEGRKKFVFSDYIADYSYWLRTNALTKGLHTFFGYNGTTTIFLKPDPKTQPPQVRLPKAIREHPMMKQLDVEQATAAAFALLADFPAKSKEIFGQGLEGDPQFKGLIYILPFLTSRNFFDRPEQITDSWFKLFDLYINESLDDKGIVMASKKNFEEDLIKLIDQMRVDGLEHPLR